MGTHYVEAAFIKTILLIFLHMNFTHGKISHAFQSTMKHFETVEMFTRKITCLQEKNMEKLSRFYSTQIVAPKIRNYFVFWITLS